MHVSRKNQNVLRSKALNGVKDEIPEELQQAKLYQENHYGQKLQRE